MKYVSNTSGSAIPIFAISLMAIIGLIAATLALSMDSRAASNLQSTADSAALAGATAFVTTDSPRAEDRLEAALETASAIATSNSDYYIANFSIVPLSEDAYGQHTEVDVNLSFSPANPMANLAGRNASVDIDRQAVAVATWGFPLCILALGENGSGLNTSGNADLHAGDCIIWSNATNQSSMDFSGGTSETKYFCTAGRARTSGGARVIPQPHEECDQIPDPLENWDAPDNMGTAESVTSSLGVEIANRNKMALLNQLELVLDDASLRPVVQNIRRAVNRGELINDADATIMMTAVEALDPATVPRARLDADGVFTRGPAEGLNVIDIAQIIGVIDNVDPTTYADDRYVNTPTLNLEPGTYHGLDIAYGHVSMAPGIYHIVNAPLVVRRRATLTGEGVSIIFHGDNATFSVLDEARLTLTGPETGPTAGFILAEHRDDTPGDKLIRSRLTGSGAVSAIGTIYLPKHNLAISGDGAADQTSPLLQIVADSIDMSDNGALDIVFAPEETNVPVAIQPQRDARLIR